MRPFAGPVRAVGACTRALLSLALLTACDRPAEASAPVNEAGVPRDATATASGTPEQGPAPIEPRFARCTDREPEAAPRRGFKHKRSTLIALGMKPTHFAQDVIGRPGTEALLEAKFAYGEIGKDLEDEEITFDLGTCSGWERLGQAITDDDGRASVRARLPAQVGVYTLRPVVDGDGSAATARVTVVPEGTRVVVFDIDGTLTTSDAEINRDVLDDYYEDLYDGDYVAVAYDGGPELTRTWAERGYLVVYLTGRPYWLIDKTRAWLSAQGFAIGNVHTTDRHRDVVPDVAGVGRFKADYLASLVEHGYRIEAAYGNAATDIWAYHRAGVPKDRTFIIGPHGGEEGTQAIAPDWRAHLTWARSLPPADQPWQP